jgi:hypothetical protein
MPRKIVDGSNMPRTFQVMVWRCDRQSGQNVTDLNRALGELKQRIQDAL